MTEQQAARPMNIRSQHSHLQGLGKLADSDDPCMAMGRGVLMLNDEDRLEGRWAGVVGADAGAWGLRGVSGEDERGV